MPPGIGVDIDPRRFTESQCFLSNPAVAGCAVVALQSWKRTVIMPLFPNVRGVAGVMVFGGLCLSSCSPDESGIPLTGTPSPYLFVYAGDLDQADADFLAVLDVNPSSKTRGEPLYSVSTGMKNSMPHHMDYTPPPAGEPLFMNAHHHEMSMIVDVSDISTMKIKKVFNPPSPLRFPHDYARTPSGSRLVGFLRSDGKSPDPSETLVPSNHGGIAEYSASGELLRSVSATVDTWDKPVRPYAFAMLPEIDRFVVTSAPMMEESWAEVVQIYRYSDFKLLETLALPSEGLRKGTEKWNAKATGFGIIPLDGGSVFLSTYECSLFHLSEIGTTFPKIKRVHTIEATSPDNVPHSCGIPVLLDTFWIQPVAKTHNVVVFNIEDPENPEEVFRLETPDDFNPHWLSKDPKSNRLILGAEFGGEVGFYVLRIDEKTGALDFDPDFNGAKSGFLFSSKIKGYISLERDEWPHGNTGDAWGHGALFLDGAAALKASDQSTALDDFRFAGACLPLQDAGRPSL